nr:MAG TPA: hypothetical protein [Caudoviricetes sp.]DAT81995.1 MAG TPA: hypothetical protein [Caudoviricetes sp.]
MRYAKKNDLHELELNSPPQSFVICQEKKRAYF